jgi:hypothetical protein
MPEGPSGLPTPAARPRAPLRDPITVPRGAEDGAFLRVPANQLDEAAAAQARPGPAIAAGAAVDGAARVAPPQLERVPANMLEEALGAQAQTGRGLRAGPAVDDAARGPQLLRSKQELAEAAAANAGQPVKPFQRIEAGPAATPDQQALWQANAERFLASKPPQPVVRQPLAPLYGKAAHELALGGSRLRGARDLGAAMWETAKQVPYAAKRAAPVAAGLAGKASALVDPDAASQIWAMQAVNAGGDTGLEQQDQERLDTALIRGDVGELATLNFTLSSRSPVYARKVREIIESSQGSGIDYSL